MTIPGEVLQWEASSSTCFMGDPHPAKTNRIGLRQLCRSSVASCLLHAPASNEEARAPRALIEETGSDLLVVGSHGMENNPNCIGALTGRMIRRSPVPVLLVKRQHSMGDKKPVAA